MKDKKQLSLDTILALYNLELFLKGYKEAKNSNRYILSSRGTKKFYTIVDKKTYDKAWEVYNKQHAFKPKYEDYIITSLDYKDINQDIYIGDIEIKVPLYSGTIDLKEFMEENKNESKNNS